MKDRNRHNLARALVIGLLALAVSACSFPNKPATSAAAEMSEPLTSGEILQVLHVINQGEIEQAELALQTSRDPRVQQVAQTIREDHRMANQRVRTLKQTLGTTLEESALSEGIQLQAKEIRQDLSDLTGSEFNRIYLRKQIELHDVALDTVKTQLLPNAEEPRIKALLKQAAPKLKAHRQMAQQSLGQLSGG